MKGAHKYLNIKGVADFLCHFYHLFENLTCGVQIYFSCCAILKISYKKTDKTRKTAIEDILLRFNPYAWLCYSLNRYQSASVMTGNCKDLLERLAHDFDSIPFTQS